MHVRIQSWFPLVIQICLNGHEWLARKLDKHGIEYRKQDNAFLWISDCERAQKFADRMEKTNWPRVFSAIARRVNPLLKDVLAGMDGIQSFAVNRSTLGHGSGRVCHGCDVS